MTMKDWSRKENEDILAEFGFVCISLGKGTVHKVRTLKGDFNGLFANDKFVTRLFN